MSVLRRYNKYQGIKDLDVFIDDDAPISQYFNIVEVPDVITQGRSSFLAGGSNLLKDEIELKFEIINDATGKVIYTEPVPNYLEGTSHRVSIEVYDDPDTFGDATLYVLGELDSNVVPVPPEWRDVYNVRWYTKIYISGAGVNTQPIFFYKQPSMWVGEIVKGFVETTYPSASITQSTGTVEGDPLPGTEGTQPEHKDPAPDKEIAVTQKGYKSKVYGGGGKNAGVSTRGGIVRKASPEVERFTINMEGSDAEVKHVGASFTVNNPKPKASFVTESYHEFPDKYETTIKDVKNESTLIPSKEFFIKDTRYPDDDPRQEVIVPLAETAYTMSFQPAPTHSVSTVNYRSFADVRISKLRTFSGDIHRVKLYSKNKDAFGDFELIADTPIESPELLFDTFGSAGSQRLGYFVEQDVIDSYWEKSSNTTATKNSTYILDSVYISGSNTSENSILRFQTTGSRPIDFYKDIEYSFRAKIIGRSGPQIVSGGSIKNTAELGIFFTGSAFERNDTYQTYLAKTDSNFGYQLVPPGESDPGYLVNDSNETLMDFGTVEEVFQPLRDGNGFLQFGVPAGSWYISDISIRPVSDTGFSPDWIRVVAPVPPLSQERPDDYEFLAEFYDVNNNVAGTIAHVSASSFQGANQYIAGTDNLLSGSLYIGNAIGSGIEMAGIGSGFIRSIGYKGFTSGSAGTGTAGFMMWSGSVLSDITDDYASAGVGLELFGSSTSYLRYRTNPSELDIRADAFFVGNASQQFISGAGNNIEISSSGFHLDTKNSSMEVAGWKLFTDGDTGNSVLSGSGAALDGTGAALYKAGAGPVTNKNDGYYIDFTPSDQSAGNKYYIRFGSHFGVRDDGILFASGAKIEGVLTASEGYIAGWTIAPNTIHKLTGGTYTGLSSAGNTRFFGGASDLSSLDSAAFNVKKSGDISGSKVFFTGGKIAGWSIDTSEIKNSNLTMSSADQRIEIRDGSNTRLRIGEVDSTAANHYGLVLFDGSGTGESDELVHFSDARNHIAGWNIDTEKLTGGSMIIRKDGTIESSGFASNVDGSGFRLTAASGGFLEVENARIRGTLSTAVFEKETVNAVGGQLYVANSTTLTGSAEAPGGSYSATETTMSVVNVTGFTAGEILSAKKVHSTGFGTEYLLIESASRNNASSDTDYSGKIYVERGYGNSWVGDSGSLGDTPQAGQTYTGSQVIVSTGKLGTGYIRLNANPNDYTTPYMDIVERTGSNIYDVKLKARLGDLSGLSAGLLYGNTNPGFGLFTENIFLTGAITAQTGSFEGIVHIRTDLSNQIKMGTNVNNSLDGFYINNNNFWYTTGDFRIGNSNNNYFHLSGSTLSVNASNLELDASNIELSSNQASMSLGEGKIIQSGKDGGVVKIGADNSNLSLTAGSGIFLSGSGEFKMGDADGNIQFKDDSFTLTGADVNINVTQLNVSSSGFTVSSPQASMSLGNNKEITLHATGGTNGVPIFKLNGGEISSSNFFVSTGGNLTASNASFTGIVSSSEANIGGWRVDANSISKGQTSLSSSREPGMYIEDKYGNPMILVASKSMFEIGSAADECGNDSFELDPASSFTSAGYHLGTSASPLTIPSWSFSSSGPVSHSITKRITNAVFGGYNAAVLGNYTFDVVHPGQFAPVTALSRSKAVASQSYLSGNAYEITQIVSASSAAGKVWTKGNVVSFAAVAKMSHSLAGRGYNRGLQRQKYKVDYWNGSGWTTFIPKSQSRAMKSDGFAHYSLGTRYSSIASGGELPATTHKLRIVLSGSINPDTSYVIKRSIYQGSNLDPMQSLPGDTDVADVDETVNLNSEAQAKYPYTEITFDNFRLKQSQPRVELSPDGFLVYQSDSSYLKMTPEGIDIRGGQGFTQTSTVLSGETNSDNIDVYGSLAAPSLQAYEADPAEIGTTGYQGNINEYAMGNHRHDLPFSTLNTVAGEGTFTTLTATTFVNPAGGIISSSAFSSPSQGTVRATINGVQTDVDTGLQTGDSPTLAGVTLSGLSAQASELTSVMINGSNVVGTRELDATAFSTTDNYSSWTIAGDDDSSTVSSGQTATIAGTAPISTAQNARTVTISVDNDGITDTHLAYNTGQHLTTTSNVNFGTISGSNIYGSGLYVSSSASTNVIQVGADGSGGIQKWEWHRDGTRKWLIYNDGRTDQTQPQDSMVFKHGLVTDGDDHINFHMEQDDQTVYFHGDINVADSIVHKGDTDTKITFTADDINITVGNVNFIDLTEGGTNEITFNEAGVDVDFRAESADDTKAIYLDAGKNAIQLGSAATTHVTASGNISASGNIYGANITASSGISTADINVDDYIYHNGDTDTYIGFPSGDKFSVHAGGVNFIKVWQRDSNPNELIFNENQDDTDLIFRSPGVNNLLRIDASTDRVGILTGTPQASLHIKGNLWVSGSNGHITASGDIVPSSDAGGDLGASNLEWNNLYIDGTAYLDSADIDGGDIASGVTINKSPAVNFNSGDVQGSITLTNLASGTGALTIQADSVEGTMLHTNTADTSTLELSSDTLSVLKVPNALTAGAGISAGGTFDGAAARTFALDINELTAEVIATGDTIPFNDAGDNGQHKETIDDLFEIGPALVTEDTVAVGTDYILFLDGGASGAANKESIPDFVTGIAGVQATTGLVGSSGTLVLTDLHPVGVDGANNQLITDTGAGTVSSEANLKFDGTTLTIADSGGAGSTSYTSGFVGSGWRIDQGIQEAGKTSATFDNLTIRGTMSVYELLINQVRATNGNLFVSSTGKVSGSVTHNGGVSYTLNFDTGDNSGHGFAANDVIRMQRFDNAGTGGSVTISDLTVASVASTGSLTANLRAGTTAPQEGFEYVRLGNTSTAGRQGGIYLTADDANAPFIDVYDNVTSHADWNANTGSANTNAGGPGTKVRIGKINGVTSATFGALSGYGLWASGSVYLEGGINATYGKIGDWTIGTALYNTKTTLAVDTGNNGMYIGTDGIAAQVGNENKFSLTTSTGAIFANTGVIGGWTLGTNLSASGMRLNPGDSIEMNNATTYALGDGIWLGNDGTARFGNASAARLQWNLTNVEIYNSGNTKLVSLGASNIIAGWEISGSRINKGNISLNATTASLRVSDDTRERVRVGDLDGVGGYSAANAKRYGIIGFDGDGTAAANANFELSNARNIIAGWTIAPTAISKGNVSLAAISATSAYLGIGTTTYGASGIFIGQTAASTYKISAVGTVGKMLWDNTKLEIQGADGTSVFATTGTGATIGGWTIDADSIWAGNKDTSGYNGSAGLTLYSGGSIHAKDFYIDTSGNAKFQGAIEGGSIDIGTNAWHVDSSGNMWWGSSANYASATIKISAAGSVDMTTGNFTGNVAGATGTFSGGVSGSGYTLNNSLVYLRTTEMMISSSNNGVIAIGETAPTVAGQVGVFMAGDGEFSFVSASGGNPTAWIKNDSSGFSIRGADDNFSVTTAGQMSAKNASIDGDIRAKSGWFGSSGSGWIVSGDQISDFSESIVLDANPARPTINIVSSSYTATIQKDFTAKKTILTTGGNSYIFPPEGQGVVFSDDGNGEKDNNNIPAGGAQTGAGITYYTWGDGTDSGDTSAGFHTDTAPTSGSTLTVDKKYRTVVNVKAQVAAIAANSGYMGGSITVVGDLEVWKYVGGAHVQVGTFDMDATWQFEFAATLTKNYSITINHNTDPSNVENWYVKVDRFKVTSNDVIENWDTGAPKFLSYQTPAELDYVQVWTTKIHHIPSSKAMEITPKGIQGVVLGDPTLESTDQTVGSYNNQYWILNPSAQHTVSVLGDSAHTGSLYLKKRGVAGATAGNSVNITPGAGAAGGDISAKYYQLQTGGAYIVNSTSEYMLYRDTGDEDGIGFFVQNTHNFQMGDSTDGGNFHAENDIIGFSSTTSDIKFKKNVIPINNSLGKVLQLRGVEFDWKEEYGDKGHDLGFIAQEVEKIEGLDVLVDEKYNIRTKGTAKTVSYEKVVPLLVEAIKEQQKQIDELTKKIKEL